MARTPPHTRLINEAARAVLRPLGLEQKGRSRVWLDDHGWWLIVAEFQPSGFSRGSYLNVGAMWLWHDFGDDPPHVYFAVGHRVEEFVGFESEEQFAPEAHRLAIRAAAEVERLRPQFPSYRACAAFLEAEGEKHGDSAAALDAAIAWGLDGATARAKRCLGLYDKLVREYEERDREEEWYVADEAHYRAEFDRALAHCQRLRALLDDGAAFVRAISGVIARNRAGLRLLPDERWPPEGPAQYAGSRPANIG